MQSVIKRDMRIAISDSLIGKKNLYTEMSDTIWSLAETKFEEVESSKLLIEALEAEGFEVERGIAGLETAFVATYGTGKPVVGFLGEYDALEDLKQDPDMTVRSCSGDQGSGHGCGHNLLGVGALAAAVAVKDYMNEAGVQNTVIFYGCPAEENGGGKVYMAQAGVFNDLDLAITWHPGYANLVMPSGFLANVKAEFEFTGKASHAALSPEMGRSALDGLELMNIGINYLREHVTDDVRMHYAITDAGGHMPNVVQPIAKGLYITRASKFSNVESVFERVKKVASGAAQMTETEVSHRVVTAYTDYIANPSLSAVMAKEAEAVFEKADYTGEELAYASAFKETFKDELNQLGQTLGLPEGIMKAPVLKQMVPPPKTISGSTDVGNVSYLVPTAQLSAACYAFGTPNHSWQLVAQGKSSIAHKGMLYAAEIMARTACRCMVSPGILEQIQAEHQKLAGQVPSIFEVQLTEER